MRLEFAALAQMLLKTWELGIPYSPCIYTHSVRISCTAWMRWQKTELQATVGVQAMRSAVLAVSHRSYLDTIAGGDSECRR